MKKLLSFLILSALFISLSSHVQRKEAYAFRYFKNELKKKDKIRSFAWGNQTQEMLIHPVKDGVEITVNGKVYKCKPFVVKENLKGTTGKVEIDGVHLDAKIIIYNYESSTVPQAKITVYEEKVENITKYWYDKPGYYEEN